MSQALEGAQEFHRRGRGAAQAPARAAADRYGAPEGLGPGASPAHCGEARRAPCQVRHGAGARPSRRLGQPGRTDSAAAWWARSAQQAPPGPRLRWRLGPPARPGARPGRTDRRRPGAGFRAELLAHVPRRASGCRFAHRSREAQVDEHALGGLALAAAQDVGALHVAVEDPGLVKLRQVERDVTGNSPRVGLREGGCQGRAVHPRRCNVHASVELRRRPGPRRPRCRCRRASRASSRATTSSSVATLMAAARQRAGSAAPGLSRRPWAALATKSPDDNTVGDAPGFFLTNGPSYAGDPLSI